MPGSTEVTGTDDAVLLNLENIPFSTNMSIFIFIASFFFLPNTVYASASCQSLQAV